MPILTDLSGFPHNLFCRGFLIHCVMLRKPVPEQTALEMVTLEELVPVDHLLRNIEAVIDFSFIHDRVAGFTAPTTVALR